MKQIVFILLLGSPFLALGQGNNLSNICRDIEEIKPDYKADDYKSDKKESATLLRNYIETKEKEKDGLEEKMIAVSNIYEKSTIDTYQANKFINEVKLADKNAAIDIQTRRLLRRLGFATESEDCKTFDDLAVVADMVEDKEIDYLNSMVALRKINTSAKNIRADLTQAHKRTDELYGFLYDDGKFRIWITIIFSLIIGSLLVLFFLFINFRYETALAKDFLSSGNGLQFIALFSLIIAIILFGVLGILEGRELAAILSGISGYILGKGISVPKVDAPKTEAPKAKPDDPVQPAATE